MKSFEEYKNEKTSTLIVNGAILTALKDITQEINYALVMIKEFNDDGRRFARSLPEETTPKQLLIISDLLRLHGNNLLSLAHFLKPKNQLTIETILEASKFDVVTAFIVCAPVKYVLAEMLWSDALG